MKSDNFRARGFDSKEAAEAFFQDARVKGYKVDPFVGIGLRMANGSVMEVLSSVKVNRNIPP